MQSSTTESGVIVVAARDHMMMRYANITAEGDYTPPPPANAKAAYATMVYVRATIVEDAGWILARATTIAVSISKTCACLLACLPAVATASATCAAPCSPHSKPAVTAHLHVIYV